MTVALINDYDTGENINNNRRKELQIAIELLKKAKDTRVFEKDFCNLDGSQIKSSGYVVDRLEAALWCLLTTDSYKECVHKAVN